MTKPRAVMRDILPRPAFTSENGGLPPGTKSHVCCPYCGSMIIIEWEFHNIINYGWRIKTRCPHLRGFGRGAGALAFLKNENDLKEEEMEYIHRFGENIVKIYRYWYLYPYTIKKC